MDKEVRIKRLYFRSAHRGSKETDLILGPYAARNLPHMNNEELDEFEAFLAESDSDIWNWVVEKSSPESGTYRALLEKLREQYQLKN